MGLVINASAETQEFKVFGNYFTLKPGQIKMFQENISRFIATNETTKGLGLVGLSDAFEDPSHKDSAEGKKELEARLKDGVDARVRTLRALVYNNQVSLRRDLEMANIKADPKAFASEGEVKAYEELVKYQKVNDDVEAAKVQRLKDLEKKIG